ncbi:MAG: hypothetical protein Q8L39_03320, partial [Burkholderiales bacterium]|nr:hypothetical protein [Burkholderiales bacterium]
KRGWYAESIDLSRYQGQTVTLRFEGHATGWRFEYVGLDYFFVRGNGSRQTTSQSSSESNQPSTPTQITTSGNARASTEDLIEYDRINEFLEHNPNPAVIKKEIAEMLKSATGNVLIIHPFRNAPAVLEKTVSVNSTNTSLEFSVRGHPVGDFLARVVVVPRMGQQDVLYVKTIVGKRGWYAESIDLSRYRGQTVTLRFEAHATGWHFEYVGLDYFFVRGDGNLATYNSDDTSTTRESTNSLVRIINERSITKDQVRRYLRSADIAITGTDVILDGKLSQVSTVQGLNWLELFKVLIAADEASRVIASKDYHGAVNKLAKIVIKKQISETLAGSLASNAFAIAKLAALPIELGLKDFANKSIRASINFQIQRYCEIRSLNRSHEFILEGRDDDSFSILFEQGWIRVVGDSRGGATDYNLAWSPPLYYQREKVFDLAKNIWEISQKAEQLQSEKKYLILEFKQLVGNGL